MTTYNFPEGFLWGAAASAPQLEGSNEADGKSANVWDHWFEEEPERFHNQVGPQITSDFYKQYKEDVGRMKAINMNSFRTSISWTRLLPDGKTVNQAAVDFYHQVIDELLAQGVKPVMNLYHFDMPMHLHEKGGWENRATVEAFGFYAKTAFELFGDKVELWATFNEPIVPIEAGYLGEHHLPKVVDMKRAIIAAYHTMLASALAIKQYRSLELDGEIGVILNLSPTYPRSDDPEDVQAANIADLLFNRSFLDPSVHGEYPRELIDFVKEQDMLPVIEDGDSGLIKENVVDFLGVNYYQPRRAKKRETPISTEGGVLPWHFYEGYVWPERRMNEYRGWEIYEKGIYDLAMNMKETYNNIPWFIAENGMGVENEERFIDEAGMVQDDYRIAFYEEHLKWLHKAIEEGSNCFGFHVWTFIDNWSWLNAYKNRYGFYRLDLATQERHLKKSGEWFKEVASKNGF